MSRRIFSFDPPDRFVCGALGQPGRRTFFLQASRGEQVVSVGLEKVQVALLAERLVLLLAALIERGVELAAGLEAGRQGRVEPLIEPVREEFRVGQLALAWDGERELVVIEARQLTDEDELELATQDDLAGGPDIVRVTLDPARAREFASGAVAVVQAGRPPCPLCGAPLDPSGHFCPRRNGLTH